MLLTVFSSCHIRKYVQAELGIPVTRLLNPYKGTVSLSGGCVEILQDNGQALVGKVQHVPFSALLSHTLHSDLLRLPETPRPPVSSVSEIGDRPLKVPLYLLYSKMKYWA